MRIKSVIIFLLLGGATIGAALFAEAIGLDNDPGWGKGRVAILVFGILAIVGGILYSLYSVKLSYILHKILYLMFQNIVGLLKLFRNYWYTFPALIAVLLVYIWFASSGSWTNWVSPTRYYAELATGFKQGKLYLLTRPASKLINLSNPYDPLARRGVEFPIDYSLYNGKFYLYWGPIPALLLILISPFTQGKVGDLYIVFSFICGLFFLQSLLAILIWERFFRDLPKWILIVSILMLGLTAPWTYMLIHEPNGRIYEAAVSGAQFFLVGGILIAVVTFGKTIPSSLSLLSIGFLWALAIGTRLVIVLPVAFMVLMSSYMIWKVTHPSFMSFALKLIPLCLPLIVCLIGLGWYNWARFGSVTETGFSYALAGVNLQKYQSVLFSPIYTIQNLYNYALMHPAALARFPFLYPEAGTKSEVLQFYSLPEVYETSQITGLAFVVPVIIFTVLPVVMSWKKIARSVLPRFSEKDQDNGFLDWIIVSLLGTFLAAFCLLLIFFWAAMRYFGDFMPSLTMLSALGFWQGYRLFGREPVRRKVYGAVGIILMAVGIVISTLLSISVQYLGFHGL